MFNFNTFKIIKKCIYLANEYHVVLFWEVSTSFESIILSDTKFHFEIKIYPKIFLKKVSLII